MSNSEVAWPLYPFSISAFVLRLICTNGMISKTEVAASYRHISAKILSEFPQVMSNVGHELGRQKDLFRISLESKVSDPESTINSFNRQFQFGKLRALQFEEGTVVKRQSVKPENLFGLEITIPKSLDEQKKSG